MQPFITRDRRSSQKPKSLYRKLTITLVVLITLVGFVVNLLSYVYSSHEAEIIYQNKLSEYEIYLQRSLEMPLWNIDDELAEKIGGAFVTNAEISLLTIVDDEQRIVFNYGKFSDNELKRTIPIMHNGQTIGSVEIGLTLSVYKERDRQLLLVSVVTALLLIVVLLSAMRWLLARLLTKPIDALVAAIKDVVEGKYQRVRLRETYSEFAPILADFQFMADAVASREASLRASEQKLHTILENVDACIYLKDTEGRYLFANQQCLELWGLPMEKIIGLTDEALFDAQMAMQIRDNDRQVLTCGEVSRREETGASLKTGQIATYWAIKMPLRQPDGSIYALCGISVDITDRKRTEEELIRYKDHLEDEVQQRTVDLEAARKAAETANLAKSVFLANMSHELRTPLNAILGFSSLMYKDSLLSAAQRDNLGIINRSGEHLLNLINDVLDMAKIEAGSVQLECAPLDLGYLVRDITDLMQIRAQEKGVRLQVDQSSKFPRYIKGDELRLRQVLLNLVGNALKFTEQGGVTVRLASEDGETTHLLIDIEDTGPGIKPEDRQKIFEPFRQVGELSLQKGTGLGLTITRQYVQLMGGTISVESTLGQGSIFRVNIPIEKADEADLVKLTDVLKGEVIGLAPNQPEYRILIVEDQKENQILLSQLMESIGFSVKVADNGAQGVQLFQSWRPHLIWMDRRMPVMDGLEATRRIRELPEGKEVKIVAVTASALLDQREEMLNAGIDEFVLKPYRFNEIYECLSRQLGVQYLYQDAQALKETSEESLNGEMFATLPPELLREFHRTLISLDAESIEAVIQQIASYDPRLQKILSNLANRYDYAAILKALEATLT